MNRYLCDRDPRGPGFRIVDMQAGHTELVAVVYDAATSERITEFLNNEVRDHSRNRN